MAGTAALSGATALQLDLSLRERLRFQVIARAKLPLAEERAELEGTAKQVSCAGWHRPRGVRINPTGIDCSKLNKNAPFAPSHLMYAKRAVFPCGCGTLSGSETGRVFR